MKKINLDVRTNHEYLRDGIRGSLNIPHDEIEQNLNKLDHNTEYQVYCESGGRAGMVVAFLQSRGYKVKNIGSVHNIK